MGGEIITDLTVATQKPDGRRVRLRQGQQSPVVTAREREENGLGAPLSRSSVQCLASHADVLKTEARVRISD